MQGAFAARLSIQTLLPYMTRRKFNLGEALVRKGERADRLHYLVDGEIEVVEFNKVLHPGVMVGEIGVFASNQRHCHHRMPDRLQCARTD